VRHSVEQELVRDEIPERDVTYIVLYDYLLLLYHTPVLPVRNIFPCEAHVSYIFIFILFYYNGHRLTKSALHIFVGYYPLSVFLA